MPALRLPTTGEAALLSGILLYLILFPLLGYKGFAYIAGIVFFSLGLRWQIARLVERGRITLTVQRPVYDPDAARWWNRVHAAPWIVREITIPSEKILAKAIGLALVFASIVVLPVLAYVLQRQSLLFASRFEETLPDILRFLDSQAAWMNARFGTEAEIDPTAGLPGLQQTLSQVLGNTLTDVSTAMQTAVSALAQLLGTLVADYVLLSVAAIIVAMIIDADNWAKETAFLSKRLDRGISTPHLRARVGRWGELFTESIGLFMVGYLEVGLRLTWLFFLASFVIAPLGLGLGTALFLSLLLGYVTAIPKIGGFISVILGPLLVATILEPGLGWFGFTLFSTGSTGGDVLARIVMLGIIAKLMGLFEAYRFTPTIVGDRLGLTKFIIVATIVMAAKAGGFFGMIWGMLGMLAWRSFKRLDEEVEAEEEEAQITPRTNTAA